jgi:hypothetical protein
MLMRMVGSIVLFQASRSDVPERRRSSNGMWKMRRSMASMSGLLAYAMVVTFCAVLRLRALDLTRLSASGACADVHRSFQSVWACVQKNVIS